MKRNYVVALSAIVLLVGGAVVASNMGFKLNKTLVGTGGATPNGPSSGGTQWVGLPFNVQTSLVKASDLRQDILNAGVSQVSIGRFNPVTDFPATYAGLTPESDFNLSPAEGYIVRTNPQLTTSYIIVGSHDPGLVVTLEGVGTNGSAAGNQLYSYPYHSTAVSASQLRSEILAQSGGGAVVSISRFNPATDFPATYAGLSVESDFNLTPGEAYQIRTSVDIAYVPSHY